MVGIVGIEPTRHKWHEILTNNLFKLFVKIPSLEGTSL